MIGKAEFELTLQRNIKASCEAIYRCWTDPELLREWFCPKPWRVTDVVLDLRTGGRNEMTMQGPEGQIIPSSGIYLEVIPNQRLVMTDAFTHGWVPSHKPFMTGIVELQDLGDGATLYRAIARHWSADDMAAHEAMGFHDGWGMATDQMEELLGRL